MVISWYAASNSHVWFLTQKINSGKKSFYLTFRYDTSVILHVILTNNVSLESQEDVDSIDTKIIPITQYWAAETVIELMYHIWHIGRERVNDVRSAEMNVNSYKPINSKHRCQTQVRCVLTLRMLQDNTCWRCDISHWH